MAYDAIQRSVEQGQPTRNYLFRRGLSTYAYTTADRDVTVNNVRYRGNVNIADDGMQFTNDSQADTLTITMPATLDIPPLFRIVAPSETLSITILEYHVGDNEFRVVWSGVVMGCVWRGPDMCELSCQFITTSIASPGLRLGWQRSCPYTLYEPYTCKANPDNFRVFGVVSSMDGVAADIPAFAGYVDGWFAGGYLEWEPEGLPVEVRGIRQQVGGTVALLGGTFRLTPGQSVRAYPGCVRTTTSCNNKFNNLPNYGGIPHMPGRSPYDGNSTW